MTRCLIRMFFLLFAFVNTEKLIKLSDILDDDTYVPIRKGEIFIIEIEGNPSEGKIWKVDNPQRLLIDNLLKPLNLNEDNTCTFYQSKAESGFANGFYHFKFETSDKNIGHEQITFTFEDTINNKIIQKTIRLHIINYAKKDL